MTTTQDSSAEKSKRKTPANIALSPAAIALREQYLPRLEFCAAYRIGETRYHDYVKRGFIRPVKVGRTVLVPVSEGPAMIERLAAA